MDFTGDALAICLNLTAKSIESYGRDIFPGDSTDLSRIGVSLHKGFGFGRNFSNPAKPIGFNAGEYVPLVIFGCVQYELRPGGPYHQTIFAYYLMKKQTDTIRETGVEIASEGTDADRLMLQETEAGNEAN